MAAFSRFSLRGLLIAMLFVGALPVFAQDAPDCDPATNYERRAESSLQEDQFERAVEAYTCLIAQDATNYEAYLGRATAQVLAAFEDNDFTLNVGDDMGVVYAQGSGLIEDAIERYSDDLSDDNEDVTALAMRGYLHWYTYRMQEAIDDFDALLAIDRDNAFGYLYRGLAHLYNDATAKAAADFRRAAERQPENAMLFLQIGEALKINGDYEGAVEYLSQTIDLDPTIARAYSLRADTYLTLEDYPAAVDDLTEAIALEPDFADHYANRAFAYELLEDYEAAIADYEVAVELVPDYAYGYSGQGWDRITIGDYEAAVGNFTDAISIDPTDPYAYLGRGTALNGTGETSSAAADFALYIDRQAQEVIDGDTLREGSVESVEMTQGRVVSLTFEADEGDNLTITASSPGAAVDPVLLLLAPDDEPLAGYDDIDVNNDNLNAELVDVDAPETGTYTLLVTHAGGGSEGDIEVELTITKK